MEFSLSRRDITNSIVHTPGGPTFYTSITGNTISITKTPASGSGLGWHYFVKEPEDLAVIKLRFGFGVGIRGDEVVVGGKKVEMGKSFFGSDFTFTASNAKTYKWVRGEDFKSVLYATPHPPRDTPPHVIAYFDDGRVGHYTRGPASIFVERAAVGEGLLDEIIATLVYVQRRYGKQPPPSGSVPRRRGGAGGGGAVGYDGGGAGFGGSDGGGCGGDGGGGGGDGGGC